MKACLTTLKYCLKENPKAFLKIGLFFILFCWFFLFAAKEINLATADLGRHLKNGEVLLSNLHNKAVFQELLRTNFYSYTNPAYPFMNHHWASGVIFFLIWKIAGFNGLSFFYLLILFASFLFLFDIAKKESSFGLTFFLSVLVIPLVASRTEIRPEVFSYFFSSVFFWLLWHYDKEKISKYWLFSLVVIMIIWANLHIYFFLGIAIIGLFFLKEALLYIKKRSATSKIKTYAQLLIGLLIASSFTPFGIKGLLFPLQIFDKYGYKLVENQSVWFLQNLKFSLPDFTLFKICLGLLVISFVVLFISNIKKNSLVYALAAAGFALMALFSIRNFALFSLFLLPIISYNIAAVLKKYQLKLELVTICFIVLIALSLNLAIYHDSLASINKAGIRGVGLMENNSQPASFLKENNIRGPIFNNYDVGAYLIYYLYPNIKPFVDNRPEAYPVEFFEKVYIPMQLNEEIWLEQYNNYKFNAIIYYWHDATNWGQQFLIKRVSDQQWAPVFVDNNVLVLVKRSDANKELIENCEISQDMFRMAPAQ